MMISRISRPAALASAALLLIAWSVSSAQAAILAEYQFTGNSPASSDTDLSTTAAPLTFPGITNAGSLALLDGDKIKIEGIDTAFDGDRSNTTAMDDLVDRGNYFSFSLTIPSDVVVNLTSLNWDFLNNNGYSFVHGVFSGPTGFVNNSQFYGYYDHQTAGSTGGGAVTIGTKPVDLTAQPLLQNLTNTTVEFRFYLGDFSSALTRIHEFDNIVLQGDVTAIPEPGELALCLTAVVLLLRGKGKRAATSAHLES